MEYDIQSHLGPYVPIEGTTPRELAVTVMIMNTYGLRNGYFTPQAIEHYYTLGERRKIAPDSVVCQFACDHECTLVGHAYEAMRFLNRCMEHGIVKSAVEEHRLFVPLQDQIMLHFQLLEERK